MQPPLTPIPPFHWVGVDVIQFPKSHAGLQILIKCLPLSAARLKNCWKEIKPGSLFKATWYVINGKLL